MLGFASSPATYNYPNVRGELGGFFTGAGIGYGAANAISGGGSSAAEKKKGVEEWNKKPPIIS